MSDNEEWEVFYFEGYEEVPRMVEQLIVEEGVEELPEWLCYEYGSLQEVTLQNGLIKIGNEAFRNCENLLKVRICNTVKVIGEGAFQACWSLTNLEFESSTSSPHGLKTIEDGAFRYCTSLPRIKLPSSVTSVGGIAFNGCRSLIEADLSTTSISEISGCAFWSCSLLQTVSLPNTLAWICDFAFEDCPELVTVVVPLDSQPIMIGERSFAYCVCLANLVLPKGSTAEDDAFDECTLLHQHYGEDSSRIVAGLMERFENFRIHRMCYDHSGITAEELEECIVEHYWGDSLVDRFGMTPFHVLFSTVEPSIELLEVLLDSLPHQILKCQDANGRRPLDYLNNNWTDTTKNLLHRALQKWMIDQLARWASMSWMESMQSKIQEILAEDDKERRETLLNQAYSSLEYYENAVAAAPILEMAMWKRNLKSGWSADGAKRQALDREECRCLSGSDVVIQNVCMFFITPRACFEEEDEGDSSGDEDSEEEGEDDSSGDEDSEGEEYGSSWRLQLYDLIRNTRGYFSRVFEL